MKKSGKKKNIVFSVLKIAGIVVASLLVLVAGALFFIVRNPWPKYDGKLNVKGLKDKVTVIRDKWGVPNIYAENEEDLIFAQGYVHAQDRLWQMEVFRRTSSGTLSEIVGYPGLAKDKEARLFGFYHIAELSIPLIDPQVLKLIQVYCDGVNAYVRDNKNSLPIEYSILNFKPAPWTPTQVLAWGNFIGFGTAQNWHYELFRAEVVKKLGIKAAEELLPPTEAEEQPLIIPEETTAYFNDKEISSVMGFEDMFPGINSIGFASGAWVVNGKHTESGNAILASDAHLNLSMPSMWLENGLHGGRFDVTGFSFPGFPFVMIGHNADISWGFTNMNPDVQDVYIEKLDDPVKPTKYLFQGEWKNLEYRSEVIKIKGQPSVTMDIGITGHGPLLGDLVKVNKDSKLWESYWTGENALALKCTTDSGSVVSNSVYKMNLAGNWKEFKESLREWDTLSQNFLYADTKGNIGYQAAGKIPIRVKDHLGIVPMPGWTGDAEWQGFIPYDELPTLYNPPQGFIVAANNKMVSDAYPYKFTYDYFHPGYRAKRINEMLKGMIASGKKISVDDMHKIQKDSYSEHASLITPAFLKCVPENETEKKVLGYLADWDYQFESDSLGAGIYCILYDFFRQEVFNDELQKNTVWGPFLPMKQHLALASMINDPDNAWFDNVMTPKVESLDDTIRVCLKKTVEWLAKNYGKNPAQWTLGKVQTASLIDPIFGYVPVLKNFFNTPKVPFRGNSVSISFAWSFKSTPDILNVQFASTQRMIIDMSNMDEMQAINSSGQNGNLFHKNRLDQIPYWANEELRMMPFSKDKVLEAGQNTLILNGKTN